MPRFNYRARDPQGKLIEGVIESADRASAIQLVEQRGCMPFRLESADGGGGKPAPAAAAVAERKPAANGSAPAPVGAAGGSLRLSHSLRLFFTEQLAYLLSAGMTLDEALGILVRRLKQPALRSLTKSLHQSLIEGRSFSQALREYPRVFSPLYVNLVLAGEASGALTEILGRIVRHLTNTKLLRDRVQESLIYPAFLAVAGFALVILFITVMVPQLTSFFANTGGSLPLPTRALIHANYLIVHYWWVAAGLAFGTYSLFKVGTRSKEGRIAWDRASLSFPGYGSVMRHQFYAQFARTLATLLQNGVTLLRAMELLEEMSGNQYLRSRMIEARAALVDGSSLSNALGRHQIFPELFLDMMAVGEQSGRFAETMQMIADVYERELEQKVKVASAIIPPIIIVMIAMIVGAVVFGIMSAVFSVTSNMGRRTHA